MTELLPTKFDFLLRPLTLDASANGHVDSLLFKRLTTKLVEHINETALRPPSNVSTIQSPALEMVKRFAVGHRVSADAGRKGKHVTYLAEPISPSRAEVNAALTILKKGCQDS